MRFLVAIGLVALIGWPQSDGAQNASPAAQGFDKLKALQGDWIDVDGIFGEKGKVAATYRVSGAGNTLIETFPVGSPAEMVTVYHRDGSSLVLTHYCAGGTQPRMASKGLEGNVLMFDYSGGANIDPAKTSHMHSARLEFVSADEFKTAWQNWKDGKPDGPAHTVRLIRKK